MNAKSLFSLLTLIGMSYENKKNSHLWCLLKSSAGCQINPIFTSKKVWKFFIQLTKSDPKSTRRYKYHPSCQLGYCIGKKRVSTVNKLQCITNSAQIYIRNTKSKKEKILVGWMVLLVGLTNIHF